MGKYDPDKPCSFSSLEKFTGCERQFYYSKVEGLSEPEGAPLVVGSCYHEVLANMWRRSFASIPYLVAKQITIDQPKLEAAGVDIEALAPEMEQNITRLKELLFPIQGCSPCAHDGHLLVECKFDSKPLGYRGVIDMVSTRAPLTTSAGNVVGFAEEDCVLDYKVVTSDRRRSERDARFSTQLALYCLVMDVRRAAYVEIPRNVGKPILVRGATFTDKELENARRYLLEGRAAIKSRGTEMLNFKRAERSYPLCSVQWCPFYERCYQI